MSDKPEWWELDGFLRYMEFVDQKMLDHNFAWVLGAGASKQSGIPTGGELVERWLKELREQDAERGASLKKWATAKKLGIDDFDYEKAAAFYPKIYERRFCGHPEEGYAYLQDLMSGEIYPGLGYAVLARVLESTRHSAVITTNFDNLVADALSVYAESFPLVCGHESLAGFAHTTLQRPLICKIHRDILLAPQNDSRGVKRLKGVWSTVLQSLLDRYTPVFIGYGGNDESLMGLLDSLEPDQIHGRLIWCHYDPDPDPKKPNNPSQNIQDLVAYHQGVLVRVPDFDHLMILLGQKLDATLPDVTEAEKKKRGKREAAFRKGINNLDTSRHPGILGAMTSVLGEWGCVRAARAEANKDKKEAIYREGIAQFPKHAGLHGSFANFMTKVRKDHDEAERLYKRALELDPANAITTGNLANLMTDVHKDHDEAERLYRRALELDPNYALHTGNFANFMTDVRKDYDEAERLYKRALELDPNSAYITVNFATFMTDVRKDHDEAERLYRKALELDPNHANNMGNFGSLLLAMGRTEEAEPMLKRADELNAEKVNQLAAEIALNRGILARVTGGDDTAALNRLKTLLDQGFERGSWTFDSVLAFAKPKLSKGDYALYAALAEAVLDADKLPEADRLLQKRLKRPSPPPKPSAKKKTPKPKAKRKPAKKKKK